MSPAQTACRKLQAGLEGRPPSGSPAAQVALAWLLGQPGVTAPIIGATKLAHLEAALGALDVSLTEDGVKRPEEQYVPHPVLGHG